jgi:hypothetical protein
MCKNDKKDTTNNGADGWGSSRRAIFWIEIIYLVVLAVLAGLRIKCPSIIPGLLANIPIGVPWFGALGAVIVSLWGVTVHRNDWDGKWKFWHWSRLAVGASLATITFIILKVGIIAVGSGASSNNSSPANFLYYAIAFVIGYREETFRDLIKKVADVILSPGSTSSGLVVSALQPASGTVKGKIKVSLTGIGFTGVTAVWFGTNKAEYTIKSDMCIEADTPEVAAPGTVLVIVQSTGGKTAVSEFKYV